MRNQTNPDNNINPDNNTNKSSKANKINTNFSGRHGINILSWNIQSSTGADGNKFEDSSFLNVIKNHDIVCLQEIRKRIKLEGFRSFCNVRPDEKFGGVGILYKNELMGGIEVINGYSITDTIICKLKKSFFKLNEDIFIVNSYVRPLNSINKSNNNNSRDILEQIGDAINELTSKGNVILCGDFNSRIGNHPGLIDHEDDNTNNFINLPNDYTPDIFSPRNACDENSNALGKTFLSLIMHNRLWLLNGRTLGDLKGDFTCIQYGGCSTVDYFATSHSLTNIIEYMKVHEFTPFSDHKPMSLKIVTSFVKPPPRAPLSEKYDKAPTRFLFDEESILKFNNIQMDPKFISIRDELSDFNFQTPEEFNIKLALYLRDMGHCCLKTTTNSTNKNKKKPWFTFQCMAAKKELGKASRVMSKFSQSEFLRKNFYKVKKSYKKIRKTSENNFFQKLNKDIENGKVLNWKQLKRIKSLKSKADRFDSLDMENFQNFFTKLYSDSHKTISQNRKS